MARHIDHIGVISHDSIEKFDFLSILVVYAGKRYINMSAHDMYIVGSLSNE